MEMTAVQEAIWAEVRKDLRDEPVASPDHVLRMTEWCERLGAEEGADLDVLLAGALVHDIGVITDRRKHFQVGRTRAAEVFEAAGLPCEVWDRALHVLEAHSRYGGPEPRTAEAKVGQDADALEYVGAIGIVRAIVRGLTDGSYDGRAESFPALLRSLLGKVDGTLHTQAAAQIAKGRIDYMTAFLERIEEELDFRL